MFFLIQVHFHFFKTGHWKRKRKFCYKGFTRDYVNYKEDVVNLPLLNFQKILTGMHRCIIYLLEYYNTTDPIELGLWNIAIKHLIII
jgi:hypothetical protein